MFAVRSLCKRIAERALPAPVAPNPQAGCADAYSTSYGRATRPSPSLLSREKWRPLCKVSSKPISKDSNYC
jgi:hypothetical protein